MTTEKQHSRPLKISYLLLIAVMVAIVVPGAQKLVAIGLLVAFFSLVLASWIIVRFSLHYPFFMVFAFALPFSAEFPVSETAKILIPGEPFLALALFVMGWEFLKKPHLRRELFSGESIWAIPFMISFIVFLPFSTMLGVSVKFVIVNLSYILVFFLWQKFLFRERPDFFPKLILLFSLSQVLVLAFSLYQFSGFNWNPVTVKAIFRPFYKDHTILGATGVFLSTFWFFSATRTSSSKLKLLSFALGTLFLGSVFLSLSRAAFLSFLFAVSVWVALRFQIRVKHMAMVALPGILLIGLYHKQLSQILYSNKNLSHNSSASYVEKIESSTNISTDISNIERLNRWYAGIKMAKERPFTGFGPGTYQFKYIPYQSPRLMNRLTIKNYWDIPDNSGGTAHSEYVLALSEMGIGGLAALLLLIGRWAWIAFEKARAHPQRKSILIAFAALSSYLFHAAFNNFLNTDKFAFLFWGFAAWMAASYEFNTNTVPVSLAGEGNKTETHEFELL